MAERLLLGTRKGTLILDRVGGHWKLTDIGHPGVNVSFVARDPRDGTLWAGLDHGHWGTKLSFSKDNGKTWADAAQIMYPESARFIDKYEKDESGEERKPVIKEAKLSKIWCIAFGGHDQPGRIWVGTLPGGLFKSDDGGKSWQLNRPLWDHPSRGGDLSSGEPKHRQTWFGGGAIVEGSSYPGIHSIVVDPRDSRRVLVGVSCAGVLETTDDGRSWVGRNKGLKATFLPDPEAEWGHDPHFMAACPAAPQHIWQQNHCGVFYSQDGAKTWREVSKPEQGVHFGFPVAVDEKDGRTAWLVPGVADDKRMAINGGLFVARTQDGGESWEKLTTGLPQQRAHDVIYRHALDVSGDKLAFGTTTGNLYVSPDRGETWLTVGNHFPPIHSVRFAEVGVSPAPRVGRVKAKAKAAAKPSKKAKAKSPASKGKAKIAKAAPKKAKAGKTKGKPAKKARSKSPARKGKAARKKPPAKKAKARKAKAKSPARKKRRPAMKTTRARSASKGRNRKKR